MKPVNGQLRSQTRSQYDVLIVGAGLFGSVCAYELTRRGFGCLVIEKRKHIGGNCYTERADDINIHCYGPHIFHTSNKVVWDWINQFARFNHFVLRPKVNYRGRIYSFPLNLETLYQMCGVRTPEEAVKHLERVRIANADKTSLEGWMLSQVGPDIYQVFIKGYSRKQWGRPPSELPASIVRRLPVRLNFDDNYYEDAYQGIPIGGYTQIFSQLLAGVEVRLNTDYFENRRALDSLSRKVLYTGPLDRFFDYRFGWLEYRSMRFEHERLNLPDFQGVAMMNYTAEEVPFTRILEHKHFEFGKQPVTWITREYPDRAAHGQEPMYPIRDGRNKRMLDDYKALARSAGDSKFYFGGRLAEYQYYDMHQVIGSALQKSKVIATDLAAAPNKVAVLTQHACS